MKINKLLNRSLLTGVFSLALVSTFAGNDDRVGSAGATELTINPWTRSAAFGNAGVACGNGLASIYTNVAGLAFTTKTEIMFDRTNWLGGAGININAAGLAQRINETTVFSVAVMNMSFGDIDITTVDLPEGGIGTFSPSYSNFNIGLAKEFSNSIYAGFNFKVVSQSISNLRGTGVALDAGIRYVTGENDNIKFGITLKNVGPTMKMKGDGLALQVLYPSTNELATLEQRSADFELPSLLSIGASYDFIFTETSKLTMAGAFTANSFSNDQFMVGADYGMDIEQASFHLMAGYIYEKGIFSPNFMFGERLTALSGLTAGFSVDAVAGKNKNHLGIQYTYRSAKPFNGIHSLGLSINLK